MWKNSVKKFKALLIDETDLRVGCFFFSFLDHTGYQYQYQKLKIQVIYQENWVITLGYA